MRVSDPRGGSPIDDALLLWFPAPASATGEDVAELHLHGGRAVIAATMEALSTLPGVRLAEPGEFTRRAFENGKLDLTQAEAIADLVDADTAAQRRQALRQLDGELGRLYGAWREQLLDALAFAEAVLDFPDEDLPDSLDDAARDAITGVATAMRRHLADGRRGERLRDGFHIAVLGRPNVGKSSLLNRLAQRDVAIVSPIPGTTRDVLEVALDLDGYPVVIADTAGLREAADEIEAEGVRRSYRRAENADLVLLLSDATDPEPPPALPASLADRPVLRVANKIDRAPVVPEGTIGISALSGQGMDELIVALSTAAAGALTGDGSVALTRLRHREALENAAAALDRALSAPSAELRAEDLRMATRAIGRVTGAVDVEDVLDRIFGSFCIGK